MKTQALLMALATAPAVLAHTAVTTFFVDGVSQGDGVAIRMRKDATVATYPLQDLESKDMACNVGGTTGVSRVQKVPDGAMLSFEIRSWPSDPTKERLARSHYGPCAVYAKKVASAIDDEGAGDGWFKLFDNGYTASDNRWCTDRVIDNNGLLNVKLPQGLQGGYYLLRPEILALHQAAEGIPQFYTSCAQIFLESSGDLVPESTVPIPGYVKAGEPSVSINIWWGDDLSKYIPPGPEVAKLVSRASAPEGQTTQTEGLRPEGCIVENANWCGEEVPDYSDEQECWSSSESCYDQATACYDTQAPTGQAGCQIVQEKCDAIQNDCRSKNFPGPQNKGKDLTPAREKTDIGLIMDVQGGGIVEDNTPAATSASVVEAAEPAPTDEGEYYEASVPTPAVTPVVTLAVADTPGAAPPVCPEGYKCVTSTKHVVETKYEYVTVEARKRRSMPHRRHGHQY